MFLQANTSCLRLYLHPPSTTSQFSFFDQGFLKPAAGLEDDIRCKGVDDVAVDVLHLRAAASCSGQVCIAPCQGFQKSPCNSLESVSEPSGSAAAPLCKIVFLKQFWSPPPSSFNSHFNLPFLSRSDPSVSVSELQSFLGPRPT